jgi:hypothetical protein
LFGLRPLNFARGLVFSIGTEFQCIIAANVTIAIFVTVPIFVAVAIFVTVPIFVAVAIFVIFHATVAIVGFTIVPHGRVRVNVCAAIRSVVGTSKTPPATFAVHGE